MEAVPGKIIPGVETHETVTGKTRAIGACKILVN
jgi:hypothetical protein